MELFKASAQWATRPNDERFWNLAEGLEQCKRYFGHSQEAEIRYSDLRVEADGPELRIHTKALPAARLSHYAFGQLCQRGDPSAPASFLRAVSPTLAAQNLNYCLKYRTGTDEANLLLHRANGDLLLRASLGKTYERLWNWEIFERLLDLPVDWRTPPARPVHGDPRARPATEADVLSGADHFLSINVGDMIGPAGVYVSDHDCFVFMVNENAKIEEGLSRGFFIWNSEVGDKSFGFSTFLYNSVCGNHIVWGASKVIEIRINHIGQVRDRAFQNLAVEMKRYSEETVSVDKFKITAARKLILGINKEETVKAVLGFAHKIRLNAISKRTLDAAYDIAEHFTDRYGDPRSLWAMVNGLAQLSQDTPFADVRNQLDRAAGRLMESA